MAAFEPRPAALAGVPTSAAMAAQYHGFLLRIRDTLGTRGIPELANIAPMARPAGAPAAPRRRQAAEPTADAAPAAAPKVKSADMALRQELRAGYRASYIALAQGRIAAAIASPTPFPERLVHFWANHFAVSADKLPTDRPRRHARVRSDPPARVRAASRTCCSPSSTTRRCCSTSTRRSRSGPTSAIGRRAADRPNAKRKVGLNENLAREIMELHTLGVGSGYTQADVKNSPAR